MYKKHPVFYRSLGRGMPVVLLHGFGEDGRIWEETVSQLENNYRLLVPDIPGSGLSSFNNRLRSIEDFADMVKAILENEAALSFAIIGHSMGGYIALGFAAQYPAGIAGLGLFHSTALADSEEKKAARRKGIDFILSQGSPAFIGLSAPNLFAESFRKDFPATVENFVTRYQDLDPAALVAYYEAMIGRPDRRDLLCNCDFPVLFIIGELDQAVLLQDVLPQTQLPKESHIHILPGVGHMGMLESPGAGIAALDRYLRRCAALM